MDSTVITRSHIWRSDVYLSAEFEMRSKSINLGIQKLLGNQSGKQIAVVRFYYRRC